MRAIRSLVCLLACSCWTGAVPSEPKPGGAPADVVLWFDMTTRLADGRLLDIGRYGLHGKITTAVTRPGPLDSAREFRKVDDRVNLPESRHLALDGPLTIALWARVDELDLHQHIVACDDKFALWITPDNRLRFSDTLGHGVETAAPILGNQWYSMVAVQRGTRGSDVAANTAIYLDGKPVATELVNSRGESPVVWAPGKLHKRDACYIGFESHQGLADHRTLAFVGAIDELVIYRRALRDDEIDEHARRRAW